MPKNDANNAKVRIAKGGGCKAKVAHQRQQNRGQKRNQQTVSECPHHRAATTAADVAVNARRRAAEEVRHQAGNNDAQAKQRTQEHTHQTSGKT